MKKTFHIGDHVGWNSEAGQVSGTIIAIHTRDFDHKGHVHHATKDTPNMRSRATRPTMSPRTRAAPCGACRDSGRA